LASQRAGSITDQPPIIPRPAPSTRETGSPPALSQSEALVRETRQDRVADERLRRRSRVNSVIVVGQGPRRRLRSEDPGI
jgi:hypothetical protein